VLVFRSGMQANALALPDGHMVFTDDLVNLIEDDNELLAILFHELGHLKHKHMVRRVLQNSMITLMVVFVTGDVDSIDLFTGLPTLILDLSYSREFESEADQFAIEQLHELNIDVDAFARAMERLDKYSRTTSSDNAAGNETDPEVFSHIGNLLSTHPASQDRVKMVAEYKKRYSLEK